MVSNLIKKLELSVMSSKDAGLHLYKNSEEIHSKHIINAHKDHIQRHNALVSSLQKILPTRKECEEPRPKPQKKQKA